MKLITLFHAAGFLSPETTKTRKPAKASRNRNVRLNKEKTTRVLLDKRICVRNMDTDMKPGEKSVKGYAKMGVHEKFSDDNSMECRTSSTSEVRNMKYGWFQIANVTVHYFQTPFNVALIVEQLSNNNVLLRENIEMDKDGFVKQNNSIIDEIRHGKN